MDIDDLVVESIETMITELSTQVDKIESDLEMIWNNFKENMENVRYVVHGDFVIEEMKVDAIDVDILNGIPVDLGSYLSISKDQTIEGEMNVNTLSVNTLDVPTLNDVPVESKFSKKTEQTICSSK